MDTLLESRRKSFLLTSDGVLQWYLSCGLYLAVTECNRLIEKNLSDASIRDCVHLIHFRFYDPPKSLCWPIINAVANRDMELFYFSSFNISLKYSALYIEKLGHYETAVAFGFAAMPINVLNTAGLSFLAPNYYATG